MLKPEEIAMINRRALAFLASFFLAAAPALAQERPEGRHRRLSPSSMFRWLFSALAQWAAER
jgi:hypothetical protein